MSDEDVAKMAQHCYGYGDWGAPYGFIGPEPGQRRDENGDLGPRLRAWRELGSCELCDCKKFHRAINQLQWHIKGNLQPAWRPLILLLRAFLGEQTDTEALRDYQRNEWGKTNGETCVIELSGLAANNLTVHRNRETFRPQRISVIRERIRENHPSLVVMYGKGQKDSWEKIAERTFPDDNVLVRNRTIFAFTQHAVARGLGNKYWKELGQRLRSVAQRQGTVV